MNNDSIDIDLVVSVLSRTVFSPFFAFLVPVYFLFQGHHFASSYVWYSFCYWAGIFTLWSLKWLSNAYRNGISLRHLDWSNQIVLITGGIILSSSLLFHPLVHMHRFVWSRRVARHYARIS